MDEPKDYNNRWRFTKDIPWSLLFAFILQTVALVWFLAGQNAALNSVIKAVTENQATAYTKDDAKREREFQIQIQLNAAERTNELLRRVTILEVQAQGKR